MASDAWRLKAAEELRSAAVMTELQRLAIRSGAPLDVGSALSRVAQDELVHAELCVLVSQRLREVKVTGDTTLVSERFDSISENRQRFLALVVIELAIGETISAALFRVATRSAREPLQRAALELILRDEALHARAGWEILKVLSAELSGDEREFLRREVRGQLANLEQVLAVPSLRRLEQGVGFDPELPRLGIISPELRVETFYRTVESRVLPSLDRLGLAGTAAWSRRYEAAGTGPLHLTHSPRPTKP